MDAIKDAIDIISGSHFMQFMLKCSGGISFSSIRYEMQVHKKLIIKLMITHQQTMPLIMSTTVQNSLSINSLVCTSVINTALLELIFVYYKPEKTNILS